MAKFCSRSRRHDRCRRLLRPLRLRSRDHRISRWSQLRPDLQILAAGHILLPQHARLPQPRPPRVLHFNFKHFAWIIPSSFWCLQIVDSFAKTLDGVASGVERFLLVLTVYQDQWSKRTRIRHSFILFTELFSLYSNSRSFSSLGSHIFTPWFISTTA